MRAKNASCVVIVKRRINCVVGDAKDKVTIVLFHSHFGQAKLRKKNERGSSS